MMLDVDREIKLHKEYMDVYIQLIPFLLSKNIQRPQLPTFEYFKENYEKMTTPHFKESKNMRRGVFYQNHTRGLGTEDGVAYRYYNYWFGNIYFTGGNINGDYTINHKLINQKLKQQ